MDGYGRRDVNGKANAGLTLGIIGTPLLNTGSLTDQIQYLEEQKRLIEARQKQIQQAANGQQTLQQVSPQQTAKVSVWDLIDAEIEPLTNEQRNMLATNGLMM